jgi:AcrR family transcriptional regulator
MPLSKDEIVRAAVAVLDVEGVGGLNMRRLGSELGAAPTAMYWHVKNKDDLIVLAGDQVWSEIELPDLETTKWRAAASELARGAHAMVSRHSWLVTTMTTHLVYGPGKARYDDRCLAVYESAGFSAADADQAAATVLMFVIGAAQGEAAEHAWQASLRRAGADEETELRATIERMTAVAQQLPHLRARTMTQSLPADDTFQFGLDLILDGLEARLAGRHR